MKVECLQNCYHNNFFTLNCDTNMKLGYRVQVDVRKLIRSGSELKSTPIDSRFEASETVIAIALSILIDRFYRKASSTLTWDEINEIKDIDSLF